jgi:hypothetical protein
VEGDSSHKRKKSEAQLDDDDDDVDEAMLVIYQLGSRRR